MGNKHLIACVVLLSLVLSSMAAIEPLCQWYGTAPFCFIGNSCPQECQQVSSNNRGDGAVCWIGKKNYCCCVQKTLSSIINTITKSK